MAYDFILVVRVVRTSLDIRFMALICVVSTAI